MLLTEKAEMGQALHYTLLMKGPALTPFMNLIQLMTTLGCFTGIRPPHPRIPLSPQDYSCWLWVMALVAQLLNRKMGKIMIIGR
jgi:hypothetical protein